MRGGDVMLILFRSKITFIQYMNEDNTAVKVRFMVTGRDKIAN